MDGHQGGNTAALLVCAAHQMAGPLGSDHGHIDTVGCFDLPEVDVEAVGKEQRVARPQVGCDVVAVDVGHVLIGYQHHHQIGPLGRFSRGAYFEAGLAGGVCGGRRGS